MASLPAGLESEVKSCCLRLLSFPGGCAPRLSPRAGAPRQGCMAAVSGSSSAAQPGQRGPLPEHRIAVRLLLQLPPSSCSSSSPAAARSTTQLLLLGDRSCGESRLRPQSSRSRLGTLPAGQLPAAPLLLRPGPLPPVLPPRALLPLQLLLFAACSPGVPAPRALASPSVPARRSHLLRLPLCRTGAGSRAESARSGYKVSAPVAAQGIKEGAGSRTSETRGRGWVLPKRATPVTFPL